MCAGFMNVPLSMMESLKLMAGTFVTLMRHRETPATWRTQLAEKLYVSPAAREVVGAFKIRIGKMVRKDPKNRSQNL